MDRQAKVLIPESWITANPRRERLLMLDAVQPCHATSRRGKNSNAWLAQRFHFEPPRKPWDTMTAWAA